MEERITSQQATTLRAVQYANYPASYLALLFEQAMAELAGKDLREGMVTIRIEGKVTVPDKLKLIDGPEAGRVVEWHEAPYIFRVPAPLPPVRIGAEGDDPVTRLKVHEYERDLGWSEQTANSKGFWPYYFRATV